MKPIRLGPYGRLLFLLYRFVGMLVLLSLEVGLRYGLIAPEDRVRTAERLGFWEQGGMADSVRSGMGLRPIWIHAASVGEVALARGLIAAIRQGVASARILLTCNTSTGHLVAQSCGADEVHYCPIDTSRSVKRVINLIEPSLLILVEAELWPQLLMSANRRGWPVALVNGRISARSFPRYRRLRALLGPSLSRMVVVCARDRQSRERLQRMGCDTSRLVLTGDLKYDSLDAEKLKATRALRTNARAPFLLAASTHRGEEELAFELYVRLRAENRNFDLVVAPRHPERVPEVLAAAARRNLETVLWSEARDAEADGRILVVDTVGELLGFMPGALGVFMGGSFVNVGGHNLLEPAAFGRPIVSGPYLANVAAVARELAAAGAMSIVGGLEEFEPIVRRWLDDPGAAAAQGEAGRAVIEANRGAMRKTMSVLRPYLTVARC